MAVRPNHSGQLGNLAASRQGETHHARYDEQINRGQLEKRGKDAPAAGYRFVGGAQRALHDILVRTPVPQPDDRRAKQHAKPGKIVIEIPSLFHNMPRGICFDHRGPCALHTCRNQRFPQIEHVGTAPVAEFAPSTQLMQAIERQRCGAHNQNEDLDGIVVRHRPHAAKNRV